MRTIEYRAVYNGTLVGRDRSDCPSTEEIIRVEALDINAGFTKALAKTREPLGNGKRRALHSIEFWGVV